MFVCAHFCGIYFGVIRGAFKGDNLSVFKIILEQFHKDYPSVSFIFFNKEIVCVMTVIGLYCIAIYAVVTALFIGCVTYGFMLVIGRMINKIGIKKGDSAKKEPIFIMFWKWLREKACIKYKIVDLDEK